jgi:anti-sigma regulatory factor (Ser/Thr protein kinase)
MPDRTRSFHPALEALPDAMHFVESALAGLKLSTSLMRRVQLVTEELFVNTVRYGYSEIMPVDGAIRLSIQASENRVMLRYQDAAPEFNPLEGTPDHMKDPTAPPTFGGLGRTMIREFSDEVRYSREDSNNSIEAIFYLS